MRAPPLLDNVVAILPDVRLPDRGILPFSCALYQKICRPRLPAAALAVLAMLRPAPATFAARSLLLAASPRRCMSARLLPLRFASSLPLVPLGMSPPSLLACWVAAAYSVSDTAIRSAPPFRSPLAHVGYGRSGLLCLGCSENCLPR